MEKIKITERLYLFKTETGSFTYYIDDDKKILIDAGAFIKEPIDLIIVTHCHFDHILFLNELKRSNKCKVICGSKEKEDIENLTNKVLLNSSSKRILPTKVDKTVKEGDTIKTRHFTLKILETPGHTNGSISIFDEENKILFSGDTWFGNNIQGRYDFPTGSKTELKKSLRKLRKLKSRILCPGHLNVYKGSQMFLAFERI